RDTLSGTRKRIISAKSALDAFNNRHCARESPRAAFTLLAAAVERQPKRPKFAHTKCARGSNVNHRKLIAHIGWITTSVDHVFQPKLSILVVSPAFQTSIAEQH